MLYGLKRVLRVAIYTGVFCFFIISFLPAPNFAHRAYRKMENESALCGKQHIHGAISVFYMFCMSSATIYTKITLLPSVLCTFPVIMLYLVNRFEKKKRKTISYLSDTAVCVSISH